MAGYSANSAWNAYKSNEKNKPKSFTYKQKKPTFSYDSSDINKYYDELLNRKDFSFDLNGNALYNQYKDMYQKQGQLAMMDTVGQAAAMTGGYGNSYAVAAGQQAYQQNLDKLNEVVPEIYQLALEQYQLEGQNLLDKYSLAAGERDTAYGMYRDDLSDYYTDRDFAYGQYRDSVGDYQADRDFLYGVYGDARDYEYQQSRDKVADKQWQQEYDLQVKEFAEQVRQFEKEYSLSEREFEEMCNQFAKEYNLDVKQFEEDVRQYNTSLEYTKQQDAVQNEQWAKEFAEEQRQYDESLTEEQRQYDASLAEEKRQYNEANGKSENGGLDQEATMEWLANFGLLDETNLASALGDWEGFIKGLTGQESSTNSYTGYEGKPEYEELSTRDQSLIEFVSRHLNQRGIEGDDAAIKALLDEMEKTKTIDSRQRALCDSYFYD